MIDSRFSAIAVMMLLALIGCQDDQTATVPKPADSSEKTDAAAEEVVASLVWAQSDIQEGDFVLSLGHRGESFKGGDLIETAVKILVGDAEVKDAVVHTSLVAEDGEAILAEERPAVFAAATDDEPAHYAAGELTIPEDATKFLIRFRIQLPEVETESIYDIERQVQE